ncbi:hypothetical protein Asera_41360 [Actinocatenispora sera]|uniref:Uncharacterized protein n=1 Tax=Actinocatenispora sera TaxID=390989 RepID=A0A810L7G3_9ACTN|nr:hypothetical protein Asera_41360 [Actinocatenispora sera]
MPDSVEMPAPVNTVTRPAARNQPAVSSIAVSLSSGRIGPVNHAPAGRGLGAPADHTRGRTGGRAPVRRSRGAGQ